jgi:anti-sigma-K factor RskA
VVEGLAPVDESRVYELWVIDQGGPQPAGLFRPGEDGSARVLVAAPVTPGITLAVTEEPATGSPQPTGEVLLLAQVGA